MNLKKIMLKKPGTESICYMIPFIWIVEQVKLSDGDGNQNSGCLWVCGRNWLQKSRRELSGRNVLYLDWSDSYMGAYICQNSSNGTLICVFYHL